MKKLIFALVILWLGLNAFAKSVQANEYNTALLVILLLKKYKVIMLTLPFLNEMQKLVYQFATEMSFVVQKHLPNILEGIALK